MNKIYKIKWDNNRQTCIVCSELCKNFGKISKLVTISSLLTLPSIALATTTTNCTMTNSGYYNPGGVGDSYSCNNIVSNSSETPIETNNFYVLADSHLADKLTIGDVNAVIKGDGNVGGIAVRYASMDNGEPSIEAGRIKFNISTKDGSSSGLSAQNGVNINAKDVDLTISAATTGGNSSGGIAAYGILAGSSVESGDRNINHNGKFSSITMDNLNLNQTTSGGKINPMLNSGLRVIQGADGDLGNGYSGKIFIKNDLNMTLKGDRLEGIYISGSASDTEGNEAVSQVILNNTNIKLIQNSTTTNNNSSAIKIGKTRNVGTGKGALYSKGTMKIDASAAVGDAIKMYETGSLLQADYVNSSTTVLANKSVITVNSADEYVPAGKNNANDIVASFKDANFNTTSNSEALIKIYGNVNNFNLKISGNNSVLNAAKNGWLFDVGSSSDAESSMVFNGTGGKYFGLTNIASNSTLCMKLSGDKTAWYLRPNGTNTTAKMTELSLENGAMLNVSGTINPDNKSVKMHDNNEFDVADGDNLITSALTANNEFTLVGNVKNTSGVIDLAESKDLNQLTDFITTLTIDGNYSGGNKLPSDDSLLPTGNGKLIVNSIWNNKYSVSDSLHIKGTASGYTEVQTKNGIIGDIKRNNTEQYSENVITVDDHQLGKNAFYGFADTEGAGQAIMVQKDTNNYAWYLPANNIIDPQKPEVPAYTLMPSANMELSFNILNTLHQRISDQQTLAWNNYSDSQINQNKKIWGRFIGNHTKNKGEQRLEYNSNMWGLQFGYDFDVNYYQDNSGIIYSGIVLTYAKDNLQFSDRKYTIFDKNSKNYINSVQQTGTGQSDIFAFESYYTLYTKQNSYMDFVGHLDYIRNKYSSIRSDNVKNNSYGIVLSVEYGHSYAIAQSKWLIEPQSQLLYQYRYFSDFNTLHDIQVEQKNRHALRGRVGLRISYNEITSSQKKQSIYFTTNIVHNFINQDKQTLITSDHVSEKLAKTWGEIGFGLQLPINKSSYIYTDIRYNHSLNNDHGISKEYKGNIGMKINF